MEVTLETLQKSDPMILFATTLSGAQYSFRKIDGKWECLRQGPPVAHLIGGPLPTDWHPLVRPPEALEGGEIEPGKSMSLYFQGIEAIHTSAVECIEYNGHIFRDKDGWGFYDETSNDAGPRWKSFAEAVMAFSEYEP